MCAFINVLIIYRGDYMREINEVYVNDISLDKILEKHKKWINNEEGGERADLSYTTIRYANLSNVDLSYADLIGAELINTDLTGANLRNVDLSGSDLRYTDLTNADLTCTNLTKVDLSNVDLVNADLVNADLTGAILTNSDLSYADLSSANLRGTNLSNSDLAYAYLKNTFFSNTNLSNVNLTGAYFKDAYLNNVNLTGANLNNAGLNCVVLKDIKYDETTKYFTLQCPEEGSFIAYKKAADNKIVKLLVTEDAKRSSATSRKCRCSKAKALSITNIKGTEKYEMAHSNYKKSFVYRVGEIVEVDNFDNNRWNECSTGIHFFMTREEAVNY